MLVAGRIKVRFFQILSGLGFVFFFFLRKEKSCDAKRPGQPDHTRHSYRKLKAGRGQAQRGRLSASPPRGGGARRRHRDEGGGGGRSRARQDGHTVSAADRAAVVGAGLVVRVARQANKVRQAGVGAPPPLTRGRRAVVRVREVGCVVLEADRARRDRWWGRAGQARKLRC